MLVVDVLFIYLCILYSADVYDWGGVSKYRLVFKRTLCNLLYLQHGNRRQHFGAGTPETIPYPS